MSLIDKLEDLVVKVDTEYQEKMEAVIREIVPGMPEGNVRHAAELMCTDRMGNMMDIDVYILREEDRPYECHYLKDLLEDRVARIDKMHEDKSYTYNIDDNYWCATCGSHSHKKDSETGYCWHCDTVNWVKEDRADVRVGDYIPFYTKIVKWYIITLSSIYLKPFYVVFAYIHTQITPSMTTTPRAKG